MSDALTLAGSKQTKQETTECNWHSMCSEASPRIAADVGNEVVVAPAAEDRAELAVGVATRVEWPVFMRPFPFDARLDRPPSRQQGAAGGPW